MKSQFYRYMGLKGGVTGVKSQLQEKFPAAFRRFDCLTTARDAVLESYTPLVSVNNRDRTAVFLDGNVILMSVPEGASSFDSFCGVVYTQIRDGLRTGSLVIVVFDEPSHLTRAKKEEQSRRDASRAARSVVCSDDIVPEAFLSDFTETELASLENVHPLKADRTTRLKLYDAVMAHVLRRVHCLMLQWEARGEDPGTLLIDGCDPRGSHRLVSEVREPSMAGSDMSMAKLFEHASPIGEGDLKLGAHEARLRHLVSTQPSWSDYALVFTSTIDTDNFPISLLDVSKRRLNPCGVGKLDVIFAMREPPTKRQREENPAIRASFLCCDVVRLEGFLQTHLWSESRTKDTADPQSMHNAMAAFATAAAVCGCDFTLAGVKGSRFDHFLQSLPGFVATEPTALSKFSCVAETQPDLARLACAGLNRLCIATSVHMSSKPRYKKQADLVAGVSELMLRRSVWTSCYWARNEMVACGDWGFTDSIST